MLERILNPKCIAVVGASDDTTKLRGRLLHLVRAGGFGGPIFPVSPSRKSVQGLEAWPSVRDIPTAADLVIVATSGSAVPSVLAEAAARGCGGAVVISSDVDRDAITSVIAGTPLRVVGPNSEGFFRPGNGVAATFAPVVEHVLAKGGPRPRSGRAMSIVSQSGGLGFALYGRAIAEYLDVHSVITTGNESDLEVLDFVRFLVEEGESAAIAMFVEGLSRPERLAEVASFAADRGVRLIVMKVGSSDAGQRAAVSHTAHLAGSDAAYDAVFRRYAIIRVRDQEELLAAAAAFTRLKPANVKRVAVVTSSGGAGAWAADICGAQGIDVPAFSPALSGRIAPLIPSFGSAANPVDVTAQITEDGGIALVNVLKELDGSNEIDGVVLNFGLSARGRVEGLAPLLGPMIERAKKPVLFHSHILPIDENREALARIGAHAFPSFRACASALAALREAADFDRRRQAQVAGAQALKISPSLDAAASRVLGDAEAQAWLRRVGVDMPPHEIVQDAARAAAAAEAIGYPVVLKIVSPDIPHKTDAGCVKLGVTSYTLTRDYADIIARAAANAPQARIDGMLVQKMMPPGHEIVIGVNDDRDFGPIVMLGSGGIYVEVLNDVVFSPAPLSKQDALEMIRSLKTYPILAGARNRPPADIDALADILVRIAGVAFAEAGALDQLDLNPVIVYPQGHGAVAVDALVAVKPRPLRERPLHEIGTGEAAA